MVLSIQPMELLAIFAGWGTKSQGPSHRGAPSLSIPILCHHRGPSVPGSVAGTQSYSLSQGRYQTIPPARSGLWKVAWLLKAYLLILPNLLSAQLVSACSITSSRPLITIPTKRGPNTDPSSSTLATDLQVEYDPLTMTFWVWLGDQLCII